MICVSVAETQVPGLIEKIKAVSGLADLIEIRFDSLENLSDRDLPAILDASSVPVVATNRGTAEGGQCKKPEKDRVDLLLRAIDAGVSHVDIELGTEPGLRDALIRHAHHAGTRVIVSFHDFQGTPDLNKLTRTLTRSIEAGADITKIVTTARSPVDVKSVLSLYTHVRQNHPLIAFCMGSCGKISRVACLAMGAYLTFASPSAGRETAAGQIPIKDMRTILNILLDTRPPNFHAE